MPLRITNIQRQCVYDGPGVRTTIFVKGCHLRCPWCCNPECQSYDCDLMWNKQLCEDINKTSISNFCTNCQKKGGKRLISECPYGACSEIGVCYSTDELVHLLTEDKELFQESGGGVTISGGEPLLFRDDLLQLISQLKLNGLNTYVETSLYIEEDISSLASAADGFIVDLKLQKEMASQCGSHYMDVISRQLSVLRSADFSIIYRLVYVDSVYDDAKLIVEKLRLLGVDRIEVLKAHSLAHSKYEGLGREFQDYACSDTDRYNRFIAILRDEAFIVGSLSA